MSFRYDKENLFKEFDVAKQKDIKLSKKETLEEKELDVYKNRIQFFKDHIKLKLEKPQYYENVDVKFDKLLAMYETSNPRDAFYMKFFGMTYAEKKKQEDAEYDITEDKTVSNKKEETVNA